MRQSFFRTLKNANWDKKFGTEGVSWNYKVWRLIRDEKSICEKNKYSVTWKVKNRTAVLWVHTWGRVHTLAYISFWVPQGICTGIQAGLKGVYARGVRTLCMLLIFVSKTDMLKRSKKRQVVLRTYGFVIRFESHREYVRVSKRDSNAICTRVCTPCMLLILVSKTDTLNRSKETSR